MTLPKSYRVQRIPACMTCAHAVDLNQSWWFCNQQRDRPAGVATLDSVGLLAAWEDEHEVNPLGICEQYKERTNG